MPDPTRPVDDASITTDWGQQVHDRTFAPPGTIVAGGVSTSVGSSYVQLQLNTAVNDPGGWLSADSLTVPADRGGLYSCDLRMSTDNGTAGAFTQVELRLNGTATMYVREENEGGTTVVFNRTVLTELAPGDILNVWAKKSGGSNPDVTVVALTFYMIGSEIGA